MVYYMPPKSRKEKKEANKKPRTQRKRKIKGAENTENDANPNNETDGSEKKKQKIEDEKEKGCGPSGILYTQYRYKLQKIRKELEFLNQDNSSYYRNKSSLMKNIEADDDDDIFEDQDQAEIKEWLRINYDPWDTIKVKWAASFELRRMEIMDKSNSFESIVEQWPRLRKKQGPELTEIDFEKLFGEKTNNFKMLWSAYSLKFLNMAKSAASKLPVDKNALAKFSTDIPPEDEEMNFSNYMSLHAAFYLCPGKDKTVAQNLEKMIRKVPRDQKIMDAVAAIGKETKNKVCPYILYYEDDNEIPYKFFICISNLVYEVSNFITAIDTLFKSCYVFDLTYPRECKFILQFIQQFFYNIFTDKDIHSNSINSLMFDLDAERAESLQQCIL